MSGAGQVVPPVALAWQVVAYQRGGRWCAGLVADVTWDGRRWAYHVQTGDDADGVITHEVALVGGVLRRLDDEIAALEPSCERRARGSRAEVARSKRVMRLVDLRQEADELARDALAIAERVWPGCAASVVKLHPCFDRCPRYAPPSPADVVHSDGDR